MYIAHSHAAVARHTAHKAGARHVGVQHINIAQRAGTRRTQQSTQIAVVAADGVGCRHRVHYHVNHVESAGGTGHQGAGVGPPRQGHTAQAHITHLRTACGAVEQAHIGGARQAESSDRVTQARKSPVVSGIARAQDTHVGVLCAASCTRGGEGTGIYVVGQSKVQVVAAGAIGRCRTVKSGA